MREIKLFFKYGLFFQITRSRKKKTLSRRWFIFMQIALLVYFAAFTTFLLVINLERFKGLKVSGINLLDVLGLYWLFLASVFFLVGIIGSAIYMLSLNEEIEFLLSLPIRRWTVVFYQIFMSIFHDLPAFGMFLGVSIAYGYLIGGWPVAILGFFTGIIHSLLLLMIGVLLAVFAGKKITGIAARRLFILLQSVVLVGFVLVLNLSLTNSGSDPQRVFERFSMIQSLLKSPLNIFGYAVSGLKSPFYLAISISLAVFFGWMFVAASRKFSFVSIKPIKKRRYRMLRMNKTYAIIRKNLKAIFMQENSLFLLLYPYIFGLFMSWQSKDPTYAILVALPISSMYVLLEASQAIVHDVAAWQLTRSLPLRFSKILLFSVLLPVAVNFLLILGVGLFGSFLRGQNSIDLKFLLLLFISVFMHTVSSSAGVYVVLADPPKSENIPKELMRGPLWLSFLLMALAGAAVFGIGTYEHWWGLLLLLGSMLLGGYLLFFFLKNSKKSFDMLSREN